MPKLPTSQLADTPPAEAIDIDPKDSVALRRLIEEVTNDDPSEPWNAAYYNRTYHRHNR